jgi:two-component system sensor histidine kinase KdpD
MRSARALFRTPAAGVVAGAAAVAIVTGVVEICKLFVPVLSLGALYVFAVLPVAVLWGTTYGIAVGIASMLAFNFFFLPPLYTFTLADRRNWFALAVYLATAVVVGELASRARRQRDEARQREREAALLADISAELLRSTRLENEMAEIAGRVADVLDVSAARIVLGNPPRQSGHEAAWPLTIDGGSVGTLYTPEREEPALGVRKRLLPALASLLGIARERERLAGEALEAEALRRSDSIKTAVIQAVSHDLRTPLATIEQALDGLESRELALSDKDREELLDTLRIEHARLKRFVENLLDLSRLQAGAASATPEVWMGEELIGRALEELDQPDRIKVDVRPGLPPVRVDAPQIQRVLVNLLENALHVSPADEPVYVRLSATRKELLIRVTDHGPGVPEEERERIFEPFHRIAGRANGRGAGLGLAIARGFTKANGGRLWVESQASQGASFVLALPIIELSADVSA